MSNLNFELIAYLKNPYLTRIPEKVEHPFLLVFRLGLICLVVGITGGLILGGLIGLKLIPDPGQSSISRTSMSRPVLFIFAVFIGPLVEELVFRAQLRRLSASIAFVAFICGAILTTILQTNWAFMISPFVFVLLYLIYRYRLAGSVTVKFQFWERIFPWHFHLTAICFALVHLSNFENGTGMLSLGLLYTLPQLGVGLILGYTRMNYGLKYSYALHALYNLGPMLLFLYKP
ncbi:type II CAAX prenyl endopeptidase Rce1 family protein [Pedobacter cryoconitis]|uniref:Membrane protease YdiL (CAAX protease family) n=1 Tax=Pedobacter cryoconitis TaxID=188932 RepID=A0A7X0MHT8_9SPHI|nr:CPBP family glutamic-type intramembrane protease [Pedobacter cryoconitis]MBB6499474.1 membrane protease YdiL (CAAX protease family) [Pedobacter cryoconitis]